MKKKANVLAWVEKAEQDFEGAVFLAGKRSKSVPDLVCFHSQQAAEKYLKACLTLQHLPFPKTHDLVKLKNLLSSKVSEIELIADLLVFLNEFSVQYRYPGEKSSTAYAKHALKAIKEVRKFFALHLEALVPAGERSRTVNEALAKELLSIRRRKLTERLRTLRKKGPAVATEDIVAALRKDRESH